jgi:hypothetical protein
MDRPRHHGLLHPRSRAFHRPVLQLVLGGVAKQGRRQSTPTDGGVTWTQRDVPFSLGSGLHGIFFLDDLNGWTWGNVNYRTTDGGTIEVRPDSERFSLSGNINLNRAFSLLITAEHLDHSDFTESRALIGLIVRF